MCELTSGNPLPLIIGPTEGHIVMWAGGLYQFDWGIRSIWIMNEPVILKIGDSIVFFDVSGADSGIYMESTVRSRWYFGSGGQA